VRKKFIATAKHIIGATSVALVGTIFMSTAIAADNQLIRNPSTPDVTCSQLKSKNSQLEKYFLKSNSIPQDNLAKYSNFLSEYLNAACCKEETSIDETTCQQKNMNQLFDSYYQLSMAQALANANK
jgi:hypothetical protein